MATTYKNFLSNDVATTRTLLHEAIPITGSIVSGTYSTKTTAIGSATNIKTYGHGMFESVYDYPYLSSSANHIFDITWGYSALSNFSSSANTQNKEKINIYNEFAQYLVGYDHTGGIKQFMEPTNNVEMKECIFVPFSRLLSKDEIKKGSFSLELGVSASFGTVVKPNTFLNRIALKDLSGSNGYNVDSPAGEYGVLYATTSNSDAVMYHLAEEDGTTATCPAAGLLYYQAGIAVLTGSVLHSGSGVTGYNGLLAGGSDTNPCLGWPIAASGGLEMLAGLGGAGYDTITGSTISAMSDGLRNRVYNIAFNNTTELNSTIYFCRVNHNDFNYSSNPTYLTGSKIRCKTMSSDSPVSYATTVGLYSADNELLAVAKLSEPLRKAPDTEFTLRVRLDY